MAEEQFYFVYELPIRTQLSSGYCFGGGNPIPFLNVDWFGVPTHILTSEFSQADLENEVRRKKYVKPGRRYLVLGSPGFTFVLEPFRPEGPSAILGR